jgi:hypothetical protein
MSGSNMFVVYTSADGNNVTISPRTASGYSEPELNSDVQVTLLEGSGVVDGKMIANVRCMFRTVPLVLGLYLTYPQALIATAGPVVQRILQQALAIGSMLTTALEVQRILMTRMPPLHSMTVRIPSSGITAAQKGGAASTLYSIPLLRELGVVVELLQAVFLGLHLELLLPGLLLQER